MHNLSRFLSRDGLPFELGILAGEISDGTPFLNAVVGHAQLERLNPGFTLT
jgi:hypothetical protein